jgi:uncharacterized protein (DUF433 family)
MTVHTIAALHLQGLTPEHILDQFPHLDLPRIYAALAYFLANSELVVAEMDADLEEAERLAREFRSPIPERK